MRRDTLWWLVYASVIVLASIAAIPPTASNPIPKQDGAWSAVGDLLTGRSEHSATLLRSGRVLVSGGIDITGNALRSSEVFDPQKRVWKATAPMRDGRSYHTATLLSDGRVLVAGGFGAPPPTSEVLASAEIYDPITSQWTPAASMHAGRARQTATLLDNGDVLVIGGMESGPSPSAPMDGLSAELYDPRRNAWLPIGDGLHALNGQSATRLPNGRVVVMGGFLPDACPELRTRLYIPELGNWKPAAFMRIGRWGHTATLLPQGKILVLGGMGRPACDATAGGPAGLLTSAEVYDSQHDTWSVVTPLDVGRTQHTATLLSNGLVLVVGTANSTTSPEEIYDPRSDKWVLVGGPLVRYAHTATLLTDGRVLVAGGRGGAPLATTLIFDSRHSASRSTAGWLLLPILGVGLAMALLLLVLTGGRRALDRVRRYRNSDSWQDS